MPRINLKTPNHFTGFENDFSELLFSYMRLILSLLSAAGDFCQQKFYLLWIINETSCKQAPAT
jgi:hypothetical protein